MRALVLTLAAVAALSGCGGSSAEKPRTLPDVSVSPSTSAAPTVEATGIDAPTPQGASEFVKFYYAEIGRGFRLRDPEVVRRLSMPSCKTCKLYVDSIAEIRDKDQRLVGGGFKIKFAVAPADTGSTDKARVDVGLDFEGGSVIDAGGAVISTEPAKTGLEDQVELSRVAGQWRVAAMHRVEHVAR